MKLRYDDVILQVVTSFSYIFPYYDIIDKNADISRKNTPGSIFCSYPIKDILNKYQTKFGYKPIKNRENRVGWPNSPQVGWPHSLQITSPR